MMSKTDTKTEKLRTISCFLAKLSIREDFTVRISRINQYNFDKIIKFYQRKYVPSA